MNNPEYVKIGEKKYKINTDFKVAIECNRISMDNSIGDNERGLAIIYKLFGDEGLNDKYNHVKLLNLAEKYLRCGQEHTNNNEEPDMDFIQDMDYIKASFRSDYNINLNEEKMHWWEFYNLIGGLSNSEFGNCCILNRIRNIRNTNLNEIEDKKRKDEMKKLKEQFALKNSKKSIKPLTYEQRKNIDNFYKMTGIERKE